MPFELIFKRFPSSLKAKRKEMMEEDECEELKSKSAKKQSLHQDEAGELVEGKKRKCRPANVYAIVSSALALAAYILVPLWVFWLGPVYDGGHVFDHSAQELEVVFGGLFGASPPPPAFHLFGD